MNALPNKVTPIIQRYYQLQTNCRNDEAIAYVTEAVQRVSSSQRATVALATKQYDLLPGEWWKDPLLAYHRRLDGRQRTIVDHWRDW